MVELINSIHKIADQFDAIVLDQWGVLHDGSAPYPSAQMALKCLSGMTLGVLSNSGKRAVLNATRITKMGFDANQFHTIMTSGEALWQLFASGTDTAKFVYPIEGRSGDAAQWAKGLSLTLTDDITAADAILLMGLPDETAPDAHDGIFKAARDRDLPLYCSNPDLKSPRGGGTYVMSPGALAVRYGALGGKVDLFGKPHLPIFKAMQTALDCAPNRILMVGDSLHHDIKGAQTAGWASLLIEAGVHAPDIGSDRAADIKKLATQAHIDPPTFSLPDLR